MTIVLILALFALGLWGVMALRNMIKKIIALNLINCSLVLLFVTGGASIGGKAPILLGDAGRPVVDPLPQALMLTAIVVGFCVTALALVIAVRLFKAHHTLDITEIEARTRHDDH